MKSAASRRVESPITQMPSKRLLIPARNPDDRASTPKVGAQFRASTRFRAISLRKESGTAHTRLAMFRLKFFIDVGMRQGLAAICSGWYSVASKVIICKLNSLPHPFPLSVPRSSVSSFCPLARSRSLTGIVLFVNAVLARITG